MEVLVLREHSLVVQSGQIHDLFGRLYMQADEVVEERRKVLSTQSYRLTRDTIGIATANRLTEVCNGSGGYRGVLRLTGGLAPAGGLFQACLKAPAEGLLIQ